MKKKDGANYFEQLIDIGYKILTLPFSAVNYCIKNPMKTITMLLYAQSSIVQARYARPSPNLNQRSQDRQNLLENTADFLDEAKSRQESFSNIIDESNKRRYIPSNTERYEADMTSYKIHQNKASRNNECVVPPRRPVTNGPTIGPTVS